VAAGLLGRRIESASLLRVCGRLGIHGEPSERRRAGTGFCGVSGSRRKRVSAKELRTTETTGCATFSAMRVVDERRSWNAVRRSAMSPRKLTARIGCSPRRDFRLVDLYVEPRLDTTLNPASRRRRRVFETERHDGAIRHRRNFCQPFRAGALQRSKLAGGENSSEQQPARHWRLVPLWSGR
jgi:hypothetical protein